MTVLAVFKSRAQTLDFISRLKAVGIPAQAVSTPKEAGVGCGISAKFDGCFYERARRVFNMRVYASFAGFMRSGTGGYAYLTP